MKDRYFLTFLLIASITVGIIVALVTGWFIAPCTYGREKTPQCIEVVKVNLDSTKKEIKFLQDKVVRLEKMLDDN